MNTSMARDREYQKVVGTVEQLTAPRVLATVEDGTDGIHSVGAECRVAMGVEPVLDASPVDRRREIVNRGSQRVDVVELAVDVVVADADAAHRALKTRAAVVDAVADVRDGIDGGVDPRVYRALDSIERTAAHGGNLAELALRGTVRRDSTVMTTPAAVERE